MFFILGKVEAFKGPIFNNFGQHSGVLPELLENTGAELLHGVSSRVTKEERVIDSLSSWATLSPF